MESQNEMYQKANKRFRLCDHPWLALLAVVLATVFSIILASNFYFMWLGLPDDKPVVQLAHAMTYHLITGFILAPFILRLPKGRRSFPQYLDDIGLTRFQPFLKLIALALSCYLILALSQAATSFIYRLVQGLPVNGNFVRRVFDLSGDLPPHSSGLLLSIPSMFEEVTFRGIILTVFLNAYSERRAIAFSAMGFGLIHLLNVASGREPVWVAGQVLWAFSIGRFYGYVFVKTRSLLPSTIVHYLGNVFVGSLSGYMQNIASVEIQALFGVVLSFGVVPTTLMILWTRYAVRWLQVQGASDRGLEQLQTALAR